MGAFSGAPLTNGKKISGPVKTAIKPKSGLCASKDDSAQYKRFVEAAHKTEAHESASVRSGTEKEGQEFDAVEKIALRAHERLDLCSARTRSMPRRMSLSIVVSVDAASILSSRQIFCGK